jgi:hypothetical protein
MGRCKDIQDGLLLVATMVEGNVRDIFHGHEQGRCMMNEMLFLKRTHWSQLEHMMIGFTQNNEL